MKLENLTSQLRLNQGRIPAQFIGPKWLTALLNIALCPVMERVSAIRVRPYISQAFRAAM
jgi:hypothetical protein